LAASKAIQSLRPLNSLIAQLQMIRAIVIVWILTIVLDAAARKKLHNRQRPLPDNLTFVYVERFEKQALQRPAQNYLRLGGPAISCA
jgi:hypothetical protein